MKLTINNHKKLLLTKTTIKYLLLTKQPIWTSWFDWVDPIELIPSSWFNQKWLPGWILSCLDLNWVQIGQKMAIFGPSFAFLQLICAITKLATLNYGLKLAKIDNNKRNN